MDLDVPRHYDWGSTLYGSMLWGLSTGGTCNKPDLQFFSYPLMPWFWAYFRCLSPYTKAENENMDPWPAGRLYDGYQIETKRGGQNDTCTHSVIQVRYQIDNFPFDSVVWSPWEDSEWKTKPEVEEAKLMSVTRRVFYDPFGHNVLYLGERCLKQVLGMTVIPCNPPDLLVQINNDYLYTNHQLNSLDYVEVPDHEYKLWCKEKSVGKYTGAIVHEGNRDLYGTHDNDAYVRKPGPQRKRRYTEDLVPIDRHLFPYPTKNLTSRVCGPNFEAVHIPIGMEYLGEYPQPNYNVNMGTTVSIICPLFFIYSTCEKNINSCRCSGVRCIQEMWKQAYMESQQQLMAQQQCYFDITKELQYKIKYGRD